MFRLFSPNSRYHMNQNRKDCPCNRGDEKGKFNFTQKKESALGSLYEVEHFLCSLQKVLKGIEIYNIFRF